MSQRICRSYNQPIRVGLSWDELWKGHDKGLIKCWEVGREKRASNPDLAKKVELDELPVLGWKGGVEKKLKQKEKYGSLYYLAQWQGLRGENLNINYTAETKLTCSRTGVTVIYTPDLSEYSQS